MRVDFVTKEELNEFRSLLLADLTTLLKKAGPVQPWLKSYEVRKLLNISAGTLHRLRSKGVLPYSRVGGSFLYKYEDVQKMIESRVEKR